MQFTSIFVALTAATAVSAARFNMNPLTLRNETVAVRDAPEMAARTVEVPMNGTAPTVVRRAVPFGTPGNSTAPFFPRN